VQTAKCRYCYAKRSPKLKIMITKCQSEQTAKVDEIDIPLSYLVFLKHESKPLSSAESEIGNDEHISLNVRVHS
jgi:hypothetical protein